MDQSLPLIFAFSSLYLKSTYRKNIVQSIMDFSQYTSMDYFLSERHKQEAKWTYIFHINSTCVLIDITRRATVTGCAPVVSFCCKGFISIISKVKMQEKIQRDLNFMTLTFALTFCMRMLRRTDADAGGIAIALLH